MTLFCYKNIFLSYLFFIDFFYLELKYCCLFRSFNIWEISFTRGRDIVYKKNLFFFPIVCENLPLFARHYFCWYKEMTLIYTWLIKIYEKVWQFIFEKGFSLIIYVYFFSLKKTFISHNKKVKYHIAIN